MLNPYVIIAVLLAFLGSFAAGYSGGHHSASVAAALEMEQLRHQHAQALADQTAKTLEAERASARVNQQLEMEKHDADQKINDALAANLASAKRLRFKSTTPRCRTVPSGGSTGKPVEPAEEQQQIELPRPIEADLFRLAAEADRLRAYSETCNRWALSIRKAN